MLQEVETGMASSTSQQVHAGGEVSRKDACIACESDCVCEHEHEFAELDAAKCPHKFGHISKTFLLSYPTRIGKVISRARRFLGQPGGQALLDKLHGVRRMNIDRMTRDDRERALRRAFRRSGATLEPVLG